MIRKYNYTGRRKINQKDIKISLIDSEGELSFNAALSLSEYKFPNGSKIYIEAYFKNSLISFSFGEIGHIKVPDNRSLSDLPISSISKQVLFRIKIVDENPVSFGRLLGFAESLSAENEAEKYNSQKSILPVKFEDLGMRIWDISYDMGYPLLLLNNNIEVFKDKNNIFKNQVLFALIIPIAIRRVYEYIFFRDFEMVREDDWCKDWIKFLERVLKYDGGYEEDEDKEEAIVFAEKAFCNNHNIRVHFNKNFKS